ncbi:hypothetical protein OROMI_032446 [Orobanche minor]
MAQALRSSSSMDISRISPSAAIFGPMFKFVEIQHIPFQITHFFQENSSVLRLRASKEPVGMTQDSRVCPSTIQGFQPVAVFIVRNLANLVPSLENGPTESNAVLEFAGNFLEVEYILVIGRTCCGGIHALMSMQDEADSSCFIRNFVAVGKNARISTKAAASNLSFDQQCRHCEKESINPFVVEFAQLPVDRGKGNKRDPFYSRWLL